VPAPFKRARAAAVVTDQWLLEGKYRPNFVEAVVVHLGDTPIPDSIDEKVAVALEVLQGRYWKVGYTQDRPVFRQELGTSTNDKQLYLWHSSDNIDYGWHISEKPDIGSTHFAWGPHADDQKAFPTQLHAPIVDAQPCPYLVIEAYTMYLQRQVISATRSADASSAHDGVVEPPAQDASGSSRSVVGHTRGGWLVKMITMLQAIKRSDWNDIVSLYQTYSVHPSVVSLFNAGTTPSAPTV